MLWEATKIDASPGWTLLQRSGAIGGCWRRIRDDSRCDVPPRPSEDTNLLTWAYQRVPMRFRVGTEHQEDHKEEGSFGLHWYLRAAIEAAAHVVAAALRTVPVRG